MLIRWQLMISFENGEQLKRFRIGATTPEAQKTFTEENIRPRVS